jgi:hypothetical protein
MLKPLVDWVAGFLFLARETRQNSEALKRLQTEVDDLVKPIFKHSVSGSFLGIWNLVFGHSSLSLQSIRRFVLGFSIARRKPSS